MALNWKNNENSDFSRPINVKKDVKMAKITEITSYWRQI